MRRCSSPSSTRSTALSGERGCSRSARNSTRFQASCRGRVTSTRPGASGHLRPMGGGTRIGSCLEDFLRRYGRLLHEGTTLVVLSDGWDLGETVRLSRALQRLHHLCHLVVWVNPYADDPRFEPVTAGMREAMPHVDLLLGPRDFE